MADRTYSNRKNYLKDKKISIMTKNSTSPEPNPEPKPIDGGKNIWAYYRQASGDEYYRASLAGYEVDAIFRINWRDNVKPTLTIRFRGEDYKITRVDDFEGYKKDLTIYATLKK